MPSGIAHGKLSQKAYFVKKQSRINLRDNGNDYVNVVVLRYSQ